MNYHLSSMHSIMAGDLTSSRLIALADRGLALVSTHAELKKSCPPSHASFLETPIGAATLVLLRTVNSEPSSEQPFADRREACAQLLRSTFEMVITEDKNQPSRDDDGCEVLYGRAGLLYALLLLRTALLRNNTTNRCPSPNAFNAYLHSQVTDANILSIIEAIVLRGRNGAVAYATDVRHEHGKKSPALMWSWHGKRYLGAAHGVGAHGPPPPALQPSILCCNGSRNSSRLTLLPPTYRHSIYL